MFWVFGEGVQIEEAMVEANVGCMFSTVWSEYVDTKHQSLSIYFF